MSGTRGDRRAISALVEVGLTEYEAKCFVALTRLRSGTAKAVSDIVDIPRTRVYDVAERLHRRGLVEIQDGDPRKFRAISTDLTVRKLERTFERRLDSAADALAALPKSGRTERTSGVWRITGQQNVTERGQDISQRADAELFGIFTEDAVCQDRCFSEADAAIERGVDVILVSPAETLVEEFRHRFPEATVWRSSLDWETLETRGGKVSRLVMADRDAVMLASIEETEDGRQESAIWGSSTGCGLVLLCRELIGSQIDGNQSGDGASAFHL